MKWSNTFLYCVLVILKYDILNLCRTNVKCWFGHKYENTDLPDIKRCKRCGCSTIFMKAIYED